MSGKKPSSLEDIEVITETHIQIIELDIFEKSDGSIQESIIPSMQAPEDWPPPPDVDDDN